MHNLKKTTISILYNIERKVNIKNVKYLSADVVQTITAYGRILLTMAYAIYWRKKF